LDPGSYTRTIDLFGNFTGRIGPRVGVTLADYLKGQVFPELQDPQRTDEPQDKS